MRKWHRTIFAITLLGGIAALSLQAQDKETADSVLKLADQVSKTNWADLTKDSAAVAKKHELLDVMTLMKMRKPGAKTSGLGVGAVPGATKPDGIEAQIIQLSKNGIPDNLPARQRGELIHMAELTAAIAATAVHQSTDNKELANWKKWSQDMYNASQELNKALQAKNSTQVKQAATNLNKACSECHTVFR